MAKNKQDSNVAVADAPTTDTPQTDAAAPVAVPKTKSPEQLAAAKRREANELKRAAGHLATDAAQPLLDRAAALEAEADVLHVRKTKAASEARPTCAGVKKDGTACTAKAMQDSTFCTDHRPVRARFSDDEWTAFQLIDTATIIDRLGWGVALKMAKEHLAATQGK